MFRYQAGIEIKKASEGIQICLWGIENAFGAEGMEKKIGIL